MSKTKVELEAEKERLMEHWEVQKAQTEKLEKQVARQQLQLQLLEQYANTVMGAGQQLISNIEALNKASSDQ